jgi:hypothetical protein
MTKSKLLSAAFVAAVMLATPAVARTSHVTSLHRAEDANASLSPTDHYISGAVGVRAPQVAASATSPSDGGTCDVGDDPYIC